MTVIPPMAAPSAPTPRTSAGGGSADGGDGVAAVFSALVAAVSAELAASEHGSTTEAGLPEALVEGADTGGDAASDAGEVDDVARAAAASLLGVVVPTMVDQITAATGEAALGGTSPAVTAAAARSVTTGDAPEGGPEVAVTLPATVETVGGPTASTGAPPSGSELPGADGTAPSVSVDAEGTVEPEPAAGSPEEAAPAAAAPGGDAPDAPAGEAPVERSTATTGTAPAPSAPMGIDAPTAPTAARATAAPAAAPSVAPALPDQLVEVLAPLRRAPDGTHRMAIQLRPDELGDVHIEFQVRGNEISLNLRADLASTNELLRDSLAQLRAELDAAGFRSGTLDVADHGDPRAHGDRPDHDRATGDGRPSGDASTEEAASTDHPQQSAVAGLDLRL